MTGLAWIRIGAIAGLLGVGIGAFGAHGLKDRLQSLGTAATFQTGSQYHMVHALALLAVGLMGMAGKSGTALSVAGWSFVAGLLLFSGSLYALAITGQTKLGAITPFGGVAFLVGWVALAASASR